MRIRTIRIAAMFTGLCLSQTILAAPAHSSVALIANTGLFAMLQSSTSQCMAYTYDRNGNRLSQGSVAYASNATWGSVTYGCFNWTS